MKGDRKRNKLTEILFIVYLLVLFWIIIFKFGIPFSSLGYMRNINLIPFSESLIINGKLHFGEIIMNIVIFIPLGVYIGALFKRYTIKGKLFLIFLISLICELSQFILGVGASDITDIINNFLGGITGLVLYKCIIKIVKTPIMAQKLINLIATMGTVLITLLLSVLIIYNL